VPWLQGFAGGTHVIGAEANAMHPTVVHNGAIIGWQHLVENGGGNKSSMGCCVIVSVGVGIMMALAHWNLACALVSKGFNVQCASHFLP